MRLMNFRRALANAIYPVSCLPQESDIFRLFPPLLAPGITGSSWDAPPPEPVRVGAEILGWRAWKLLLENDSAILRSTTMETLWPGPRLDADRVPDLNSGHGLYALKSRATLQQSAYGSNAVVGEVAMWGIVIEGSNGYQAEHQMIRSLVLQPNLSHPGVAPIVAADLLSARYGVDCTLDWREPGCARYGLGLTALGVTGLAPARGVSLQTLMAIGARV